MAGTRAMVWPVAGLLTSMVLPFPDAPFVCVGVPSAV
jgi:hypothetical protein